ncbi:hypothetical protein [Caulobacter sp. S45]|uniref:hypothetical protein n=1 Tax=Caulobacter sp. S45 TaxID=1641861 RepID=UPI001575FF67|nr:hypothetical protein [Caulobacter sp. S45]
MNAAATFVPPRTARKAAINRAIKAVTSAGLKVSSVKLGVDGSVEVLTGAPKGDGVADELDAFRANRNRIRAGAA